MRFTDFLRTTVMLSLAAASVLAVVTLAGVNGNGDDQVLVFALIWWAIAGVIGAWIGRRFVTTQPIAALLANAKTQQTLPELNPGSIVLQRLWPLLLCTALAGAVAFLVPQVPAVGAGFTIILALSWRRQSSAVKAIEDRDGAQFYVERSSLWQPIRLIRSPGFRSNVTEMNGHRGAELGRQA
jgi:hypothetical protein